MEKEPLFTPVLLLALERLKKNQSTFQWLQFGAQLQQLALELGLENADSVSGLRYGCLPSWPDTDSFLHEMKHPRVLLLACWQFLFLIWSELASEKEVTEGSRNSFVQLSLVY